jgi:hypothetical protein
MGIAAGRAERGPAGLERMQDRAAVPLLEPSIWTTIAKNSREAMSPGCAGCHVPARLSPALGSPLLQRKARKNPPVEPTGFVQSIPNSVAPVAGAGKIGVNFHVGVDGVALTDSA